MDRQFRNAVDQACMDAIMQLVLLLVAPLGLVLALLVAWLPFSCAHIQLRNLLFIAFAIGVVSPIILWTVKRYSHYKHHPDAAAPFRANRERNKSTAAFVMLLILLVATAASIDYLVRASS
jgi:uncharacterized protein YacL